MNVHNSHSQRSKPPWGILNLQSRPSSARITWSYRKLFIYKLWIIQSSIFYQTAQFQNRNCMCITNEQNAWRDGNFTEHRHIMFIYKYINFHSCRFFSPSCMCVVSQFIPIMRVYFIPNDKFLSHLQCPRLRCHFSPTFSPFLFPLDWLLRAWFIKI